MQAPSNFSLPTGVMSKLAMPIERLCARAAWRRRTRGCPIVFGAASDAMVFDRAALEVPFPTADGGAFAHVLDGLEQRIREGFPVFVGEVCVAIARQLSEGRPPSVAAPAEHLGVTRLAVSQTIRRLEDRLGVAPVQRTTRSVSLTEVGEQLFQACGAGHRRGRPGPGGCSG